MSKVLANGLKILAGSMAQSLIKSPDEATARRCVSTAYYAVFRLIIDDGLPLLFPTQDLCTAYARKMDHGTVKKLCSSLEKGTLDTNSNLALFSSLIKTGNKNEVKDEIKELAKKFCALHSARENADYNTAVPNYLATVNVSDLILKMKNFFVDWDTLKTNDLDAVKTLVAVFLIGIEKIRS